MQGVMLVSTPARKTSGIAVIGLVPSWEARSEKSTRGGWEMEEVRCKMVHPGGSGAGPAADESLGGLGSSFRGPAVLPPVKKHGSRPTLRLSAGPLRH
jgi:hypothetical protein